MKFTPQYRQTLCVILDGGYTPLDVREFVQLCYLLALPLVRSRIARGKLNLEILGLSEGDIVYDCLADLFRRDATGQFVHVKSFFENQNVDPRIAHEDEVLLTIRRLVFGRVHHSIVRLYSEGDPALGKVLRNLSIELDRSDRFEHRARFGETYLIVRDADPCLHRPPIPSDRLRQKFSQIVSVRDSVPEMLRKLHKILLAEDTYQRAAPLVAVALIFKEAYAIGVDVQQDERSPAEQELEQEDLGRVVESVCRKVADDARPTYVGRGKRTQEEYGSYIAALREILLSEAGVMEKNGASYFELLKIQMPGLTRPAYMRRHKPILEYLARRAKRQIAAELKKN
jgi:hypothetical protein